MSTRLNRFVATAGGIGYLPFAPGTWASIAAAIVWYFLALKTGNDFTWQFILLLIVIIGGVYCSAKCSSKEDKDPSRIVIDEVAGMWVALFLIPPTYMNFLAGFILFRFFDIAKPFGIRKMESLRKGWGIMLDDLLAGIYSNVLIRVILFYKVW